MAKRDYYEILEVSKAVTDTELKKAFRKKAMAYHPDRNSEPGAEEKFKEIAEAYEVLSDDQKRAAYDRYGHQAFNGASGGTGVNDFDFSNFQDIFDDLFRGFGGSRGNRRTAPRRGADLRFDLSISFEEAYHGVDREIELVRAEICSTCNGNGAEPGSAPSRCDHCGGAGEVRRVQQSILGSFVNVTACPVCSGNGEIITKPCNTCDGHKRVNQKRKRSVRVPPGVDDDTQIRLTGEGQAGANGGPAGNVYVLIHVQAHEKFDRRGDDIILSLPISVARATLGGTIAIPTMEGEERLELSAGTQPGHISTLRRRGMPRLRRGGRGDMLVYIQVVIPTKLDERERSLYEQLDRITDDDKVTLPKQQRGFFENLKEAFGF